CDELLQVVIIKRIGLAEVATGVELVEPDFARRRALLKEQHHGLDARALKRAAWHIQYCVQIAVLQKLLTQRHRGIVGVRQERVLDDDSGPTTRLERFDEMLQEQERGLAGLDRKILLHLRPLLPAEWRVGQRHVDT